MKFKEEAFLKRKELIKLLIDMQGRNPVSRSGGQSEPCSFCFHGRQVCVSIEGTADPVPSPGCVALNKSVNILALRLLIFKMG